MPVSVNHEAASLDLKKLVGSWIGTNEEGNRVEVSFRMASNDTV
ncbi:hypothetical protein [Erythrobacter crassostreae]|nr:hypothetical protein [Erythrobacter crassostrea]